MWCIVQDEGKLLLIIRAKTIPLSKDKINTHEKKAACFTKPSARNTKTYIEDNIRENFEQLLTNINILRTVAIPL